MSTREPQWYCHGCRRETTPIMVPHPQCSRCDSDFVERIENPEDDPRGQTHFATLDDDAGGLPGMMFPGLMDFLVGGMPGPHSPQSRRSPTRGVRVEINRTGSGGGTSSYTFGGPNTLRHSPGFRDRRDDSFRDDPPNMTEFLRRSRGNRDREDGSGINGPLMMQYLLSMLASRSGRGEHDFGPGPDPLSMLLGMEMPGGLGGEGRGRGQWGDYVFSQEALDQIITQMMENSNAHRPVPASDEVMDQLPREVVQEGSLLLERDCAVCKEQFKATNEDPDDNVVITLPCKHPFHQNCILPWLKSSGTCPVCRYALVSQPDSHPPGSPGASGSGGSGNSSGMNSRPLSPPGASGSGDDGGGGGSGRGGLLGSLLGRIYPGTSDSSSGGGSRSRRMPGEWGPESLD